jgi:hypothetical protein
VCPEKGQKKCPIWLIGQTSEAKEEGCETTVCKQSDLPASPFFEAFLETPELHPRFLTRRKIQKTAK